MRYTALFLFVIAGVACSPLAVVPQHKFTEVSAGEYNGLKNDLMTGCFYCGSAEQHHYIVIVRKLFWTSYHYVKIEASKLPTDKAFPFTPNREKWVEYSGVFPASYAELPAATDSQSHIEIME